MKKTYTIFLLISLFILIIIGFSQMTKKVTNTIPNYQAEQIMSISQRSYAIRVNEDNYEKIIMLDNDNFDKNFDENENIIEEIMFNSEEEVKYKLKYEYVDSLGNKIIYMLNAADQVISKMEFEFSDSGIERITNYEMPKNEIIFITDYDYKSKGIIDTRTEVNKYKNSENTYQYYYKDENIVKIESYDIDKNQTGYTNFSYDINGNIILENLINDEGILIRELISTYDKLNNITKQIVNVVDKRTQLYEYSYTYDKNNNWITKITTIDGRVFSATERKIIYIDSTY